MNQPKIKDPKKVAAGMARAAKAIRVGGKFTTNIFLQEVEKLAKDSGATDPFRFYLQNEKQLSNLYQKEELSTNQNYDSIRRAVKNFKGKIFKNGREVKKATMLKSLSEFNQILKSEYDVVNFYQKIKLGFTGKLKIEIPTRKEVEKAAEIYESITEMFEEEFDIGVIISDPKSEEEEPKGSFAERKQAQRKKYNESKTGKAKRAAYRQTEKAQEAKKAYKKTASGKAEKARYRKTHKANLKNAKVSKGNTKPN